MRLFALLAVLASPALAEVPADFGGAQVVFLGEVHDNPHHHRNQAEIIAALEPKAVVFEMLTPAQAEALATSDPSLEAIEAALDWAESGWPGIDLYHPVFAAARARQPIGVANGRDEARRAFKEGAASVFGPQAARFGLTEPVPAAQQTEREALQFAAHCEAMPLEMMAGMVEAQRFRDARIAEAALTALADHGAPVVVITGNGHAQKRWGAARMVAAEATVFSIAHTEPGQSPEGFDITYQTPAAERDDPCAAFN